MKQLVTTLVGVIGLLAYDSDAPKTSHLGSLLVSGAIFTSLSLQDRGKRG